MDNLPAGQPIARTLRRFFARQAQEAVSAFRAGSPPPDLRRQTGPMVAELLAPVRLYVGRSGEATAGRIARQLRENGHQPQRRSLPFPGVAGGPRFSALTKRNPIPPPGDVALRPKIAFDLFHPNVEETIKRLTFDFCQSTNDTSAFDLVTAFTKLRQAIREGLELGEAVKKLSKRVEEIFQNPMRAVRIARTEASRATHAGELLSARQSGVVKALRWVAKSDACEECLKLQGVEVALGDNFAVDKGAGAYSSIPHPPRH
jgi:hypothetical protein